MDKIKKSQTILLLMVLLTSLGLNAQTIAVPAACNNCSGNVLNAGTITTLDCGSATHTGTLAPYTTATGVSSNIAYLGGNGKPYTPISVNSTGVLGLTATIPSGTFANGAGNFSVMITGMATTEGTANFVITIGGQTCTLTRTVSYANSSGGSGGVSNGGIAKVCPVNMASGKVRNWLCHNLGADDTADPHTPSWKINGAYIISGGRGPTTDWRTAPSNPSLGFRAAPTGPSAAQANADDLTGLPTTAGSYNYSGTNPTKSTQDPCPTGYRVPMAAEFQEMFDNNLAWGYGMLFTASATNYDGIKHFGPNTRTPMISFPANGAGNNAIYDEALIKTRGRGVYLWAADPVSGGGSTYFAPYMHSSTAGVYIKSPTLLYGIRCISYYTFSLNCAGVTHAGTLVAGTAASGVSSTLPFTGANGEVRTAFSVTSTGVTGLTATIAAGTFPVGAGNLTVTITGTPSAVGTASFAINIGGGETCIITRQVYAAATGSIAALNCAGATHLGELQAGKLAFGVSSQVPYTGGIVGPYTAVTASSTGVTGLTATIAAGAFANGAGNLTVSISGTPSSVGTASFALTIGGQSCTLSRVVIAAGIPKICPVDMGGGVVKGWLCHNLGADNTIDPHTPAIGLQGSYIKWGKTYNMSSTTNDGTAGYAAAPTASSANAAAISGWDATEAADNAWNSGSETVPVKTATDPCPSGFRVPTRTEWSALKNNTSQTITGTPWTNSSTNYGTMVHFGTASSPKMVSLPTSGFRTETGALDSRGMTAVYPSSSVRNVGGTSFAYVIYGGEDAQVGTDNFFHKFVGYPVRCISE